MPPRIYPRQIRNPDVEVFINQYNKAVNKPPIPVDLLPIIQNNYVLNFRTGNFNKYTAQTMQKLKPTEVVFNKDNQATIFDTTKLYTFTLQVEIAFRHISNQNYTQTPEFEIQIKSLDKTLGEVRQAIVNFNRILLNRNTNPVLWDSIIEQVEDEPDYPNEDWVIEHISFNIRGNDSIIANTQTLPNTEVIPYLPLRRNIQNSFQEYKNRFLLFREVYKYVDPKFDYEKIPELSNGDGYCIGHLVKSVKNSNKLMDKKGYSIAELEEYCISTDTELKIYNPNLKLIYTFDITNPKNKKVRKLNFIYTSQHCYAIDTDVLMTNRYKDFISDVKVKSDNVIDISKKNKEKNYGEGATIKYIYDDDMSEVLKEYDNFKNGITTKITFKYKYNYREIVENILNKIEELYKDRPIIKETSLNRILKIEYRIKVKLTEQEKKDKVQQSYNTFKITTPEHFINIKGMPVCKENTKPVYNLSIGKMIESIDKIKKIATSTFHKTLYNLFNYQYNTMFRVLQRDGFTNDELTEEHLYSLDIIGSHKNALLDLEGDIPIFCEADRFIRLTADNEEPINKNYWYIVEVMTYNGEFRFPFKNTYTHWDGESLIYLIMNGFVDTREIKYVLKPSKLCPIKKIQYIYQKFLNNIEIDTTLSIKDQLNQKKFNENMFIGMIGKGSEVFEYSFYTDYNVDEANLYKQTKGYKVFTPNNSDRLLITNHFRKEFLHNLSPIYQKIRNKEVVNICQAYLHILTSGGIPYNIVADEIGFYHKNIENLNMFIDKTKYKLEVNKIVYTAKPEKAEFRSKMKRYPTRENELDSDLYVSNTFIYSYKYADPEYFKLSELMNDNFNILAKNKTIDKLNKKFKININSRCIVKKEYKPFVGFICGNPGCGKTYFITKLLRNLYYLPSNIKILKLAFTNSTAQKNKTINIDAFTFHSFFSISDSGNENTRKLNIYDIIYIEEISMVPREFLKYLYDAKHLGKSIIITGDLRQLPAIKEKGELKTLSLDDLLPIVDNNVYQLLYSHRFNKETLEKIESYCNDLELMKNELPKHQGNLLTGLCYKNETRKYINSKSNKLFLELNKPDITLNVWGIENDKNYEFTQNITICKDIPLIAYKTNKKLNIYNGLNYKVSNIDLEKEIISVKEDDGGEIIEVSYDKFSKIFVLGFGISLYKTQGATLEGEFYITDLQFMKDKVENSIFVAISRCTNINNIYLDY